MFPICLVSENDFFILCDILKFFWRTDVNQTFSETKIMIIKYYGDFAAYKSVT